MSAPATWRTFPMRSCSSMRSRRRSCISRASAGVTSQRCRSSAFIGQLELRWEGEKKALEFSEEETKRQQDILARSERKPSIRSRALLQLSQHQLGHFAQRLEHASSLHRYSFHDGLTFDPQVFAQLFRRHDVGEVALVELEHVRNRGELQLVLFE